ncbi:LOW QUALITY PROTEIN: Putative retroelement [Phytophthora palmivora]|uniref:Retroelement n=1 Tax=Phytophthora palmivora TaxID=4796 RepID=A0A2P4XTU2_9STRA|nr:LOW QUALITY PROTEIN: Putative retroelement [Phytophthora palmivora]
MPLAMKYALVKFRVHHLGPRPFVIYTDHGSLRTVTNSPHLSQRMTRLLSFFAEYNFHVEYKRGKFNDVTFKALVRFLPQRKNAKVDSLSPRQRAQLHRHVLADGLLHYRVDPRDPPRVVAPNDEDLKYDILLEAHDALVSGHLGREKPYQAVSQIFWWTRMHKWVAHYVKTYMSEGEAFGHASAPLQSLPVPADCWKSMSLDFVFGLPADDKGNTRILAFVCRLSKMVHLAPVCDKVTGKQVAQLFLDSVFRYHGLPETIVSDRDPRFTGAFWDTLFQLLGTKLTMSTARRRMIRWSASTACSKIRFAVSVLKHLGPRRTNCLWLSLCSAMRYTHQRGLPVLLERATTLSGAANLAGRHRGLHPKWGRGSESLFLPGLGNRARVFTNTVVVVYRQQVDVGQPG